LPAGDFGLGRGTGAHAPDEYYLIDSKNAAIKGLDCASSSDPGLTAIYSGQISGNKIVNGYVIWKWKGFPKGLAQGTWNASW
jgi:hypothetical protein